MPLKKLSTKECKQKLEPWITTAIITKISRKNDSYKKFMKTRSREIQLQFNKLKNEGTVLSLCNRNNIILELNELLVVEYYSRR